jgi:phospholipase C
VLALETARSDDPLQGVAAPAAARRNPSEAPVSHLQRVHAELAASLPVPGESGAPQKPMPELRTDAEAKAYIDERVRAWEASQAALSRSRGAHA